MIYVIKNKTFKSNTYIITNELSDTCLIIDPGLDKELIEDKLVEINTIPIGILSTHGHFDHIGSAAFFQKKYNIPFYMHEKDLKISQSANFFLKIAKVKYKIVTPRPNFLLNGEYNEINIGKFKFKLYNYPGHSEGGIIIEYQKQLFTGDLLFKKGMGFNCFPGGNKTILKNSIINIFKNFDEDCIVYPGHGTKTTIGYIKNNNLELNNFLNNETVPMSWTK